MNPSADVSTLTVRPARLADASAFASLATQLGYPSTAHQVKQRMTSVQGDSNHLVLAAALVDTVVGWAHACVCCLIESDPYVELGGLVVDKSHRGKGVGKILVEEVENWARQRGCGVVSVRSNIIRDEAHRFYLARGYEKVKTQHTFRKRL